MVINEAIKVAMKNRNYTQNMMAKALGFKTANQVSSKMAIKNWTMKSVLTFLNIIGYEVVIRPCNDRKNEIIITEE